MTPSRLPVLRPVNRARSPLPGAPSIMGAMRKYVACLLLPCAAVLAGPQSFVPEPGVGDTGSLVVQSAAPQVERVLVRKSERRLYLMKGDEIVRSYRISLGLRPEGGKERAGDYRTPEGSYRLERRNPNSDFFLSIQVSYPGPDDMARARRNHWNPGGSVMVHGQPNTPRHPAAFYAREDWTDGCIALSNADMVEFWRLTRENMPIDIEP